MTLDQINQLSREQFTQTFGGIFEHSPWVAERAWLLRPFASGDDLHAAMCGVLADADDASKLGLIRAHPQLAGRAAIAGELTQASASEQRGAGLDQCSADEFAQLHRLNDAYQQRFGFPYIIAVRGHTRESIIANMAARVDNPPTVEFIQALRQIERIAGFRLADMMAPARD